MPIVPISLLALSSAISSAQTLSEKVAQGGSITIAPGTYDEQLAIEKDNVFVSAYNVILKKPILIRGQHVRLEGITVEGSEIGVQMVRGQGSSLRDVNCSKCGVGFLFAGREESKNTQVTYSTFQNCIAMECKVGWEFDSTAKVARSWFNANTLINCCARGCDVGWQTIGEEPNFSYNSFYGGSSEKCKVLLDMPHANDVTFFGCHMVCSDPTDPIILGRHCRIVGGRWIGTIPKTVVFWTGGQRLFNMQELEKSISQ